MGKLLALTVALPVAAVAAGAGYLTWNNVQRYEAEEQRLLTNVRQELQAQGLALDAEPVSRGLFGVFREDIYTLRDIAQATDLIAVRQTTTIEPLRAYGTFAVDGERGLAAMLFSSLPGLLEGQQGQLAAGCTQQSDQRSIPHRRGGYATAGWLTGADGAHGD